MTAANQAYEASVEHTLQLRRPIDTLGAWRADLERAAELSVPPNASVKMAADAWVFRWNTTVHAIAQAKSS